MKELSEEEYNKLQLHSQMLGIIGTYVEDWCDEEDTVLCGVMCLLAEYHAMRSNELYEELRRHIKTP